VGTGNAPSGTALSSINNRAPWEICSLKLAASVAVNWPSTPRHMVF